MKTKKADLKNKQLLEIAAVEIFRKIDKNKILEDVKNQSKQNKNI